MQFTDSHLEPIDHWGYVTKDGIEIMFVNFDNQLPESSPIFTGSLYLNTNNVNAWWDLLKDKATIYYPIENFSYNMRVCNKRL